MDHRIGIIGRIEAWDSSGAPANLRGEQRRRLLAILAVARGESVDDGDLLDRLWVDTRPTHATASLRNMVADLRRALGHDAVDRTPMGYRLDTEACPLDLDVLERHVERARELVRAEQHEEALACLDDALALVRGRPFDLVADETWAVRAVALATEQIAQAEEFWADLRLATGRSAREIPRLQQAATAQPHREIRWRQLVAALGAADRRREAVAAVEQARRALAEFGLEPSLELLELERSIIGVSSTTGRVVPIRRDPIVGRVDQLADLMAGHRIVWLEGDLGAGKTRLLAEFADRALAVGETVLYAACRPEGGRPIAALVAEALAAAPGCFEPSEELAVLVEGPTGVSTHLDPAGARLGLVDELARLFEALAARAETVVLVDDVHDVDPESGLLVAELVRRRLAGVRWVFAGRPATSGPSTRLRHELERSGEVEHVGVGALDRDDLDELAALLAPEADPAERSVAAEETVRASRGHALFATELLAERLRAGPGAAIPIRLDAIVAGMLERLDAEHRGVVEMLAMASGHVTPPVVAAAAGVDAVTAVRMVEQLEAAGFLAPASGEEVAFRHDAIRDVVALHLPRSLAIDRRRRLIGALEADGRDPLGLAYQYLALGDLLDASERAARDRAVAEALARLSAGLEYGPAVELARRFLALDDLRPDEYDSVRAHVHAASALIAANDAATGRPLLRSLMDHVRRHDQPDLRADALLALGPVATGSSTAGSSLADETEQLAARIDPSDDRRRVQLLCWAAHHRAIEGGRERAIALLDEAASVVRDPRPTWDGLILAVRAQADTLAEASPDEARRSHRRLADFAARTGDVSSEAAARLTGVVRAFVDGTLDDVRQARDDIEQIASRVPRPDLCWWPSAVDAALALATGHDDAEAAIDRAEREGERLGVEIAGRAAIVQRSLHLLHTDRLGEFASVLQPAAERTSAPPSVLALYGLACIADGGDDAVCAVASRLARRSDLLGSAGIAWPQVAMAASDVAFAAGHVELAEALCADLLRHSGDGLAVHGIGYFGTVDRCLALLAYVLGEREHARLLARSAHQQELRRGATAWAEATALVMGRVAQVA